MQQRGGEGEFYLLLLDGEAERKRLDRNVRGDGGRTGKQGIWIPFCGTARGSLGTNRTRCPPAMSVELSHHRTTVHGGPSMSALDIFKMGASV